MTAAFALLLAAAAPVYAQTAGSTTATPSTGVTATQIQAGQFRATDMNGANVYDSQNQKVGDVKDIILDQEGRVAAVVLDVGSTLGMGGKYVAVAMNDLKITEENGKPRFSVSMTKDQLKSAQAFDLTRPTTGSSTPPSTRPSTTTTTPSTTTTPPAGTTPNTSR
jgi:sporulation protein YlmC with PRC-barrel domain